MEYFTQDNDNEHYEEQYESEHYDNEGSDSSEHYSESEASESATEHYENESESGGSASENFESDTEGFNARKDLTKKGAPGTPNWVWILIVFVLLAIAGGAFWWFKIRTPPTEAPAVATGGAGEGTILNDIDGGFNLFTY